LTSLHQELSDKYRLGLAYSNIQFKAGLPVVVAGVVAFEDQLKELQQRDLPRKHNLMKRVNRFYALQEGFNDVSQHLENHEVSIITGTGEIQRLVEEAYIKLLRILTKSQLYLIIGKTEAIVFRIIETYNKKTKRMEEATFSERFIADALTFVEYDRNRLVFAHDGDYDRLLDIAKILASAEYERTKLSKGTHVVTQVSKDLSNYLQILKVTWNCPPIDEYSDFDVGPPALVIRKGATSEVEYVYIRPGLRMNLAPLAKFCRGGQDERQIVACKQSAKSNPFGQFMIGSAGEQCAHCRGGFECVRCLSRTPLCDGYHVQCGNVEFAGNICCGLFALYVTRFGRELKVGTSMLPNIVGRLLEQGVNSALILQPIEGIMNAHILEMEVKDYLFQHLEVFSPYGIDRVHTRAPPADDKLKDFLSYWARDDLPLLQRTRKTLSQAVLQIEDRIVRLDEPEYAIRSFLPNYRKPPDSQLSEYRKAKPLFNAASGVIVGYRGSFAFLNTGNVIDLKALSGYVVRGRIGGKPNA